MYVDHAVAATEDAAPASMTPTLSTPRASLTIKSTEQLLEAADGLLFLEVRPAVFACIWGAMLALHVVCGTFMALQARLYMYLTSPYLSYYVHFVEHGIVHRYSAFAVVFGVFSLIHWNVVLRLCLYSIRQRKLAFFPAPDPDLHAKPPDHHEESSEGINDHDLPCHSRLRNRGRRAWRRVRARLHTLHLSLFSRRGVFGVESHFFYLYFYTREAIELTSQIYQAYRASMLVGQSWLANLYVVVIAVNCFSTPLVQYAFKARPELRRIFLLAIDASLDFVMAIVVPTIIFAPYARLFDLRTASFPVAKVYDETWFVNAVLESQEVFCVSVLDLCFKMVPHVSITGCLRKVRALVHKDTSVRAGQRGSRVFNSVLSPAKQAQQFESRVAAFRARQHQQHSYEIKRLVEREVALHDRYSHYWVAAHKLALVLRRVLSRATRKYANKLARLVLIAIGVSIICLQLFAYRNEDQQLLKTTNTPLGCRQRMRPWFATKLACSVYEVNCHALGISGATQDVAEHLERLHAGAVVGLVFTHCSALEMPPQLARFSNLMLLDMYNCSVASWPAGDSALTVTSHPRLSTMSLVRVNFSSNDLDGELPAGLVDENFPTGLVDMEIVATDLAALPPDLHIAWRSMHRLFIEHSPRLTHVPPTLAHWQTDQLSLASNALTTLSAEFVNGDEDGGSAQKYFNLALLGNPLTELPTSVSDEFAPKYLYLQSTNLTEMPAWVGQKLAAGDMTRVFAARSPFCEAEAARTPSVLAANAPITCSDSDFFSSISEMDGGGDSASEEAGDENAQLLSVVDQGGLVPLAYIDQLNVIA